MLTTEAHSAAADSDAMEHPAKRLKRVDSGLHVEPDAAAEHESASAVTTQTVGVRVSGEAADPPAADNSSDDDQDDPMNELLSSAPHSDMTSSRNSSDNDTSSSGQHSRVLTPNQLPDTHQASHHNMHQSTESHEDADEADSSSAVDTSSTTDTTATSQAQHIPTSSHLHYNHQYASQVATMQPHPAQMNAFFPMVPPTGSMPQTDAASNQMMPASAAPAAYSNMWAFSGYPQHAEAYQWWVPGASHESNANMPPSTEYPNGMSGFPMMPFQLPLFPPVELLSKAPAPPKKQAKAVPTQSGVRVPHYCKICNKPFRRLGSLNNHLKTHSGQGLLHCEFDGCGRTFLRKAALLKHMQNHETESNHDEGQNFNE